MALTPLALANPLHEACGSGDVEACGQLVRHHAVRAAHDAQAGASWAWRLRAITIAADQYTALATGRKPSCFYRVPACGVPPAPPAASPPRQRPTLGPPPSDGYRFLDPDGIPLLLRRATDTTGAAVARRDLAPGTYDLVATDGLSTHLDDMIVVEGSVTLPEPGHEVPIQVTYQGPHPVVTKRVADLEGTPMSGVVAVAWSPILHQYYVLPIAWDGTVSLPSDHEGQVQAWVPEDTTTFDVGSTGPPDIALGTFVLPEMSVLRRDDKPRGPTIGTWTDEAGSSLVISETTWGEGGPGYASIGPGVFLVESRSGPGIVAVHVGRKLVCMGTGGVQVLGRR